MLTLNQTEERSLKSVSQSSEMLKNITRRVEPQNTLVIKTSSKEHKLEPLKKAHRMKSRFICMPISCFGKDLSKVDLDKEVHKENRLDGGHRKNFKILGDKIQKSTCENEFQFYLHQRENPNDPLNNIIPKTFDLPANNGYDILMENCKYGLTNPITMDVKIGRRTMCQQEMKRQGDSLLVRSVRKTFAKAKDFFSGSSHRGYRVVGGKGLSKHELINSNNSENILKSLIKNKRFNQEVIESLYQQLVAIKKATKNSDYAFVDSSIFIAIDEKKL